VSKIDAAIRHASTLLREHAERYPAEIIVEALAWRRRYDEQRQDLDWLEFVRDHPITPTKPRR
jgi:hypothetical protein